MGKVRILPPALASKIAAGEVVERPASVVKELVENSLDAGASRIRIELYDGGKLSVRVSDDGEGMSPEDVQLAIRHHATSKISTEEDLERILTLGFRGEALPSIASVSRMGIITRANGHPAVRLEVEGGRVLDMREVGAPRGTVVEVRDLFFNLPARRKFLKSTVTEFGHCLEAVVRLALPRPEVSFVVHHQGKERMVLPPSSEEERILKAFGEELQDHLLRVGEERGELELSGWITSPGYFRGNARGIYLYVNGRYVRDRMLLQLLGELYADLIPRGAYPLAVLKLKLPPEQVDVNVHPTKIEVRFRAPEEVYQFVKDALRGVLGKKGFRPAMPQAGVSPSWLFKVESPLRVVGQAGSWIVAEEGGDLLIFDQHALHERILYEELKASEVPTQRLILPQVVELSQQEVQDLMEARDALRIMGFDYEPFGPRSLLVKAIPSSLRPHEIKEFLQELSGEFPRNPSGRVEEALKLLACRGAVKAGESLSEQEMTELLRRWEALSRPQNCPHGRPLLLRLSQQELLRRFKRQV